MSCTTLYLVRHGATEANLRRPYVLQGLRPDAPLAPTGHLEARAVATALADVPFAAAYCSPLDRARSTAAAFAGLTPTVVDALAEVDVGRWTGLTWEEIERDWPEERRLFRENSAQHGYVGGENLAQVRDRVVPALEELVSRHLDQPLLVVAHGVVNRVLLGHWLGLPLTHARALPQDNAAYNIVEFEGGSAKVRSINAIHHLKNLSNHSAASGPV